MQTLFRHQRAALLAVRVRTFYRTVASLKVDGALEVLGCDTYECPILPRQPDHIEGAFQVFQYLNPVGVAPVPFG
jgi:hypothetical protein